MASYQLSERALADLDGLFEHGIRTFGLALANEYYDALIVRFQDIADRPKQWAEIDEVGEGLRRSVFGSHSIYYRIESDNVAIVRILGYQDLGRAFDQVE